MKEILILFVDDEPSVLSSLERYLITEPYKKLFISTPEKALKIMARTQVHIVVSDMRMPGMDGLTFLRQVKESYPDTIRMVLSGFSEIAQIIPCINTGEIYRYIAKPIEPPEFRAMLNDAVQMVLMKTDKQDLTLRLAYSYQKLKKMNQANERASLIDGLTGLYNTRFLYRDLKARDLKRHDSASPLEDTLLSIAFLDVDSFKSVVDRLGHMSASKILSVLGKTIAQNLDPPCYGATLGGDLFILVLPDHGRSAAIEKMDALKALLEASDPGQDIPSDIRLTFTHGLGVWPEDGKSPLDLLGIADHDLAANKSLK